MTARTFAVAGNFIVAHEITGAFNQQFVATRTKRAFPMSHVSRQIPGIDKVQSLFHTDFRRANELMYGRSRAGRSFCNRDETR